VQLCEEAISLLPGIWSPYYELGMYYLRQGAAKRARETFEQYPLFLPSDRGALSESINTVTLSNNAYTAGAVLHWTGAIQEARPLFERSSGYQTGSGRGMLSEYWLAMYDKNYVRAADAALSRGRRYAHLSSYRDYLRLLRVIWNAPETETLFFSLNLMDSAPIYWEPVLISLRMEGKSDEAIRLWLAENNKKKVRREQAQQYYINAFLIDRQPDPLLADMIENIEKHVPDIGKKQTTYVTLNNVRLEYPSHLAMFVSSWNSVRLKQYTKAFALFEPWIDEPHQILKGESRSSIPALAWSGSKVGKKNSVEKVLQWHRSAHGRDFEYWLSTAIM
jgi:tetratricopeptide (TPR) repeat protein